MRQLAINVLATCLAGALAAAHTVAASAQQQASTLPATPVTSAAQTVAPLTAAPGVSRAQRPAVSCDRGDLTVQAHNASLNAILREISRCTGMKITGGVADSRVFGDYGPAPAGTILATLLDGTGANMVLHETADAGPAELILTPRNGGPTPPDPAHSITDDGPEPTEQLPHTGLPAGTSTGPQPSPGNGSQPFNVNGSPANQSPTASQYPTTNSVPVDSLPQPGTTPATSGIVDSPNPPAPGSTTASQLGSNFGTTSQPISGATVNTTGTTTQSSPNGVPTPEQIFQELQKLKQQQQGTPQ